MNEELRERMELLEGRVTKIENEETDRRITKIETNFTMLAEMVLQTQKRPTLTEKEIEEAKNWIA